MDRGWSHAAVALAVFLVLGAIYTHPLLKLSASHIANDPYDPILNTSILWWNATTTPLTRDWWNPPHYYPAAGVQTFTEHLLGISVVTTPAYWLTRNPLFIYNLALFLTWPLSAWTAYLLGYRLTRRHDAAILAGLAYGFTPYRTAELSHVQSLSSYWLPLVLLSLHAYVDTRHARWLVLFGASWLLQSLANGYYILFGSVLIALWMAYFCTQRDTRRAALPILLAWAVSSLPLVPILSTYHRVHALYGLRRTFTEIQWFSANPLSWFEASGFLTLWSHVLPDGKDNLFPGVTVLALVVVGIWLAARRHVSNAPPLSVGQRRARGAMAALGVTAFAAAAGTALFGPWRIDVAGVAIRMTRLDRAFLVMVVCGAALAWRSPALRGALARRSELLFYSAGAAVAGLLSFGPVLRRGESVLFEPMPYGLLMFVPGFDQLRVPTRFWMLGVLCLAVAASLAFSRFPIVSSRARVALCAAFAAGILADGWIRGMNMAAAPIQWPRVERRDSALPILELPLGPDWDAAATYRAVRHRRRVLNGVSGYDPPQYAPLFFGLESREPELLRAIASLGPFEIVVNGAQDPDGALRRYATSVEGTVQVATDGLRTAYRVPQVEWPSIALGERLPIVSLRASSAGIEAALDGSVVTEWQDGPQRPGQWVMADLGAVRDVGGVSHGLGEFCRDFPRRLAIDVSIDATAWQTVWEGPTVGQAFLEGARAPLDAVLRFSFPTASARFVRLRQLARHRNLWRMTELAVHAPAR